MMLAGSIFLKENDLLITDLCLRMRNKSSRGAHVSASSIESPDNRIARCQIFSEPQLLKNKSDPLSLPGFPINLHCPLQPTAWPCRGNNLVSCGDPIYSGGALCYNFLFLFLVSITLLERTAVRSFSIPLPYQKLAANRFITL